MSANVLPFQRGDGDDPHRPLPANIIAEVGLLGAILAHNECLSRVTGIVEAASFFDKVNQQIFQIACDLIESGRLASPLTIRQFLPSGDIMPGVTANQYAVQLAAEAVEARHAVPYAIEVRDAFLRRKVISEAQEAIARAFDPKPGDKVEDLIGAFEDRMSGLRPHLPDHAESRSFDAVADDVLVQMAASYQNTTTFSGVRSGLTELDQQLGGLQPGDFVVIAGRPGSGKTALGGLIARECARDIKRDKAEGQVLFFTIEMPDVQIGARIICDLAGVATNKIRRGTIDELDYTMAEDIVRSLRGLPMRLDQSGRITMAQVAQRARQHHRRKPLKLVVIDYLQLMSGAAHRRNDNRVQELSEITSGLKALAKELGCPILALSQLSRKVDERDNKRPFLSDLRDSGSIEQDADIVMFAYREEYYVKERRPLRGTEAYAKWEAELARVKGRAEIIVGKSRHGDTFAIECGFVGAFTRFEDQVPEAPAEEPKAERAKREKPVKLTADASILFGVLKTMSISHVVDPVLRPRLEHPKARLIEGAAAKRTFGAEMGLTEAAEIEKAWKAAFKALRANELAFWCADPATPFVYVNPEKLK